MEKRLLAQVGVLGCTALVTLFVAVLCVAPRDRSAQKAATAPATARCAHATPQEKRPLAPWRCPAAPAEEPVHQAPEEASDDEPLILFSVPSWDSFTQALEMRRKEKALEEERQAIRDAVASEKIEESVRNLLTHDLSPLFSRFWRDPMLLAPYWDAPTLCEDLEADPRIAKLLETIRQGSKAEVDRLYDELRKGIDTFLNELPLTPPIGEPRMPTVMEPWSANALPLLLAPSPRPSSTSSCSLPWRTSLVGRIRKSSARRFQIGPGRPRVLGARPPRYWPTTSTRSCPAWRTRKRAEKHSLRSNALSLTPTYDLARNGALPQPP